MTTLLAYIALLLPSYEVKETVYRDISVYSDSYHLKLTKDESVFSQDGFTVADYDLFFKYKRGYNHKWNRVFVRIEYQGNSCFAELTDITARKHRDRVDVSRAIARELTGTDWGLWFGAKVEVIEWEGREEK